MKKRINKEIIVIAIISVLFLMMSIVYADYLYNSNHVSFNNNNTTLTSTDVQSAIDELYNKCSNIPAVGTCPEGYECTPLTRVTYNANGGTFTSDNTTNEVNYSVVDNGPVEKISKTSNVDDEGNQTGYMPQSGGTLDTVTIEGAESLEVEITYQTYSSSYSYVYVRNAAGTNVSSKLYGQTITTKTYTVTGDTVQFFFYNYYSQSSSYSIYYGYYAKVKGKKNNEYIKEYEVTKEEGEYSEPTKTDYTFIGWTENADGSGTLYRSEQEVMNSLNTENRNLVLYAKWFEGTPICKRATTLHTETCTKTSTSEYCRADGNSFKGTITYGSLGTAGVLTSGDAFDCDVNGDGTYDSETERFYYVSDYFDTSTQTFDNDYAVFIYYSNTANGNLATSASSSAWYSSNNTSNGPITARNNLPTTSQWRDDMLKTRTRNIYSSSIYGSISSTAKSNFSYEGYAARLLTIQELYAGCPNINWDYGSLSGCKYLYEKTAYSNSAYTYGGMPWLESVYSGSSNSVFYISVASRRVYYNNPSDSNDARPVIEILKTDVSY